MKHNARTNALVGAGVAACAVAGTLLNEPQSRWYRSLRKPDWQPAPAVFPIAWTALYAAVGLSSASVINRLNKAGWDQDAAAFARALGPPPTAAGRSGDCAPTRAGACSPRH